MKMIIPLALLCMFLLACSDKSTNSKENSSAEFPLSSNDAQSSAKGSSALAASSNSLVEDTSQAAKNDYEPNNTEAQATLLLANGVVQKHSIQEDGYGTTADFLTWQVKPGWATHVYVTTDRPIDIQGRRVSSQFFSDIDDLYANDTVDLFYYSDSAIQPMLRISQPRSYGDSPSHYKVWMVADSIGFDSTETNCEDPEAPSYSVPHTLEALHGDKTDIDCFRFKVQEDSTYVFRIDTLKGFVGRPFISIQNASLYENSAFPGDSLKMTVGTDGIITIEVADQIGGPWYGKYRIKASTVPSPLHVIGDEYEPNSLLEPTAAVPGIRYDFTVSELKKDEDAFLFERKPGADYLIVVSSASEIYGASEVMDVRFGSNYLNFWGDSIAILSQFDEASSTFELQFQWSNDFAGSVEVTEVLQDSFEATEDLENSETFALLTAGTKMNRTITYRDHDGIKVPLEAGKSYTLEIQSPIHINPSFRCPEQGTPTFPNEVGQPGQTYTVNIPAGLAQDCRLLVDYESVTPKIYQLGSYSASLTVK